MRAGNREQESEEEERRSRREKEQEEMQGQAVVERGGNPVDPVRAEDIKKRRRAKAAEVMKGRGGKVFCQHCFPLCVCV